MLFFTIMTKVFTIKVVRKVVGSKMVRKGFKVFYITHYKILVLKI